MSDTFRFLPFIFFFSSPHPHSHPAQLLVNAAEKPAIFPNTVGEGGRALTANHCSNIRRKLQKAQMKESPRVAEGGSHPFCFPECRVWFDSWQIRTIYHNFIPGNDQEGAAEIGDVMKAVYGRISHRKRPSPPCANHTKLFNLDCPFSGIHPAFAQLLLTHRLDYFRDFNSEHEG